MSADIIASAKVFTIARNKSGVAEARFSHYRDETPGTGGTRTPLPWTQPAAGEDDAKAAAAAQEAWDFVDQKLEQERQAALKAQEAAQQAEIDRQMADAEAEMIAAIKAYEKENPGGRPKAHSACPYTEPTWLVNMCLVIRGDRDDSRRTPLIKALLGIDTFNECRLQHTLSACSELAVGMIPAGRGVQVVRAAEKIKTVEKLAAATTVMTKAAVAAKVSKVKSVALKADGKPYGRPGSAGVWEVTEEELEMIIGNIRREIGAADKSVPVAGKGDVEYWAVGDSKINYRNFSGAAGSGDWTIDFAYDLQRELGLKRYHVPRR
ncbi:hypothetical protein ACWCYY_19450 [Kitasatospora sp. NPDC001664]